MSLAAASLLIPAAAPASAAYQPGEPPGVNPGTPQWTGQANPIPDPPASFDPAQSTLQAIFDADVAAGGTSYWFDRILARPFSLSDSISLMTRGRALYMYTHNPSVLGFAARGTGATGGGGFAYRQPPTTGAVNLYTVTLSGDPLTEDTSQRTQYPSHYSAVFNRADLTVGEKKFITDNDVAVTDVKLYFYSNKQFGSGGNTYREPSAYTIQYYNGSAWVDAPGQLRSPGTPAPNYNEVSFRPVTAQLVRVLMTRQPGYAVGLKELQVFNTNPLAKGFWANPVGQAIISGGGSSSAGVCNLATSLRQYGPFQDLNPTASCDQVASYVASVTNAATCGGSGCNAMLKAQMLTAALDTYLDDPALASASVDLTGICTDAGTCSATEDDSGAFGGAPGLTVSQILAYAAGQSNAGGSSWYGNVKADQVMAKDVFQAISNQEVSSPAGA